MTARRLVATRRADEDVERAVDHYLGDAGEEVALEFIEDFRNATSRLAAHPSLGSARFEAVTRIPDIRVFALPRYPYVVVYTDDADVVRVHRVLHTRRDITSALAEEEEGTAWARLVSNGRVTLATRQGQLTSPPVKDTTSSAQILGEVRADRV